MNEGRKNKDIRENENDIVILTRRERKKRDRKYEIISVAQALIDEKGYDETSIKEITDAVDISYATFYNYFNSKDELLLSINQVELEDLQEILRLRYNEESSVLDQLKDIYLEWNKDSLNHRNVSLRLHELNLHQSELGLVSSFLCELIEKGIRKGEFLPDTNAELIVLMLSGLRLELVRCNRRDLAEPGFNHIIDSILAKK